MFFVIDYIIYTNVWLQHVNRVDEYYRKLKQELKCFLKNSKIYFLKTKNTRVNKHNRGGI